MLCKDTKSLSASPRSFAFSNSASLSSFFPGSSRASLSLSADYLRSPLFVFAVSNAIIAALLAQSRR
ncbi:hypothetical protein JHK82_030302 [Glycine max]|nr:hypothetical protein JHK85_030933 [Glycine max]KAG4993571.1 hypothetical protein JHK86_030398 [Glycine max]KAG5123565.1 hypothetical protein JHK82_030302 [Glycine max]KAG5144990.1 hypothetical protein JHK84_030533 [Glycine max]